MKEVISKRPPRCFTKLMRARGDFAARRLGDIAVNKYGRVTHKQGGPHEHAWIPGADIEVCVKCGMTRPKSTNPSPT